MGPSIWGWRCWQQLAWLAEKWPHSWHSRWRWHLFSAVLTEEWSEWTGHGWRGWGMSPCQGTLGVQWHLWVLGEHGQHRPSPDLGGHHWHCVGSQRSLWLGPLHAFSVDWTQLHTCRLPTWGSADGVMFHLSATMYGDVIGNSDSSRVLFKELVHLLLEDGLWTDQTKGKMQEMVPPKGAVEGS